MVVHTALLHANMFGLFFMC